MLQKQIIITSKVCDILCPSNNEKLAHAFLCLDLTNAIAFLLGYQRALLNTNKEFRMQLNELEITLLQHWLPVSFIIEFRILLLVFKRLHGTAPIYFSILLNKHTPARSLRTSNSHLLVSQKHGYKLVSRPLVISSYCRELSS